MNRIISAVVGFFVLALLANSTIFVVDQRQFALVFALGEVKSVIREPGLYFKLPAPFQNVIFIEKRILTLESVGADRFITSEKKNVVVDTYVKWRVVDPRTFYVSVSGRLASAEDRIGRALRDGLNNEIATRTATDVISGQRERVMEGILSRVSEDAKQIGVEIVDVRLRRVDFADEIRESVFRRMESERKAIASERRSQGAAEAEKIRANAERQRDVILAEAYREAQKLRGDGDARATAIYAKSFGRDPEFASFYRSLEAYRASFASKNDVLVVDPKSDFFRHFQSAPRR